MVAADSRFDYLSCADGTWGNELHGVLTPEIKKSPLGNGRGFFLPAAKMHIFRENEFNNLTFKPLRESTYFRPRHGKRELINKQSLTIKIFDIIVLEVKAVEKKVKFSKDYPGG